MKRDTSPTDDEKGELCAKSIHAVATLLASYVEKRWGVVQPCALCLTPTFVPQEYFDTFGNTDYHCCDKCVLAVEEARVMYRQLARWEGLR